MSVRVNGAAPCTREDPDRFYPKKGTNGKVLEKIKDLCRSCPFVDPCREWAVAHERNGVWGATTESERRAIRRARGTVVEPPSWADTIAAQRSDGRNVTCWECGKTMLEKSLSRHEETCH